MNIQTYHPYTRDFMGNRCTANMAKVQDGSWVKLSDHEKKLMAEKDREIERLKKKPAKR